MRRWTPSSDWGPTSGTGSARSSARSTCLPHEPGIDVRRTSRIWETDSVGGPEQPDFLNVVAHVRTTLEPLDLLEAVNRVEATLGRTRDIRWGPRTIDIDILLIDDLTIDEPRLDGPAPPHAPARVRRDAAPGAASRTRCSPTARASSTSASPTSPSARSPPH